MSSPGMYFSMSGSAVLGMIQYSLILVLFSGTRVKILPELKLRSFSLINLWIASSEFRDTA